MFPHFLMLNACNFFFFCIYLAHVYEWLTTKDKAKG